MSIDAHDLARLDPTGQRDAVLGLPEHVVDALDRAADAALPRSSSAGLVIAGMGGSAIGGRLARAVLGPRERRPIVLVSSYDLPVWVDRTWTVLLSSYSGATEETLACWAAAERAGARRVVATTGGPLEALAQEAGVPVVRLPAGFQPRAAVGYATVTALVVAAACGVAPSVREELVAAAEALARSVPEPGELVEAIGTDVPLFLGAEATAPVAYRWKAQVNENANRPAFCGELPEHDHNEVEGWGPPIVPVFLVDPETHPRTLRRFAVTAEVAAAAGRPATSVRAEGASAAERVLGLVRLGDLVSVDMALAAGTDPVSIPAIDRLKRALSA